MIQIILIIQIYRYDLLSVHLDYQDYPNYYKFLKQYVS